MGPVWIALMLFISAELTLSSTDNMTQFCRSRGKYLPQKVFKLETCYLCYYYMPTNQFKVNSKWRTHHVAGHYVDGVIVPWLTDANGTEALADIEDEENPLLESFLDSVAISRWEDCCQAAVDCCQNIKISASEIPNDKESVCPPTWDGWQCWPQSGDPDEIEYQPCPRYIFFSDEGGGLNQDTCGRYAEKQCNGTGKWLEKNGRGEWTDYTTCSRVKALLTQEYVHLGLYATSIVALVPAIIIFFSYKTLRVPRIAIHKNLFASLLLHCITMITFKSLVLIPYIQNTGEEDDGTMLQENTPGCRLLMMLSKYFRLTNYTWMFCEGYYLHRLLANTFEEERSLVFILAVGWGFPFVPCLIYGISRIYVDNSLCWALPAETYEWVEWIYMTPGLLCILANFCFFINIFRILVTKLQAPHANEPAHFRKAVHATVVLLPLFGLHWLLTLYRPQAGASCFGKTFYKYLNIILDGLQGLMVSIAFCYRNGEITTLLSRSISKFRLRNEPVTQQLSHQLPKSVVSPKSSGKTSHLIVKVNQKNDNFNSVDERTVMNCATSTNNISKTDDIRLLLNNSKKRFRERFAHVESGSGNHIPMKKISRKNSETYFTQVGFSTFGGGSRMGSRYSLNTAVDSPSPPRNSLTAPSFKNSTSVKTVLEVRKSTVSNNSSIDSL